MPLFANLLLILAAGRPTFSLFLFLLPQVRLPPAGGRAELALEHGLVARVYLPVGLERVALGEPGVADLALVRLLPGVDAEVPLQLEGVRGGVGTVRALGN